MAKIKLDECGERYYPVSDTHNTFAEGGRKIHIKDSVTGRCLCGYEPSWANEVYFAQDWPTMVDYILQPDPDGNICKRCKNILIDGIEY